MKLLFLSNKRSIPCGEYSQTLESGLVNSIRFIIDMLNEKCECESKYVAVDDYNCIDKEIVNYLPNIVVIEAIWVTPLKLQELSRLHTTVKFIVRIHSELGFISSEGVAMDWLLQYSKIKNVSLSSNSTRMTVSLKHIVKNCEIFYLPNYYSGKIEKSNNVPFSGDVLNVASWGAIRVLKNQFIQAVAAIMFADAENKPLRFHINTKRLEGGGEPVLKNLRALFADSKNHKLIEIPWLNHSEFIKDVKKMDILLQTSFTETFNLTVADSVANYIPVVVSPEISWLDRKVHADPNDVNDIVAKMTECMRRIRENGNDMIDENLQHLERYNGNSVLEWKKFIAEISQP